MKSHEWLEKSTLRHLKVINSIKEKHKIRLLVYHGKSLMFPLNFKFDSKFFLLKNRHNMKKMNKTFFFFFFICPPHADENYKGCN